jgi:methylenetetrahydrofolate reductase (NADPH)
MQHHLFGVRIPESVVRRLEAAADSERAGIDLCVEIVERLRTIDGVGGIHVMAFRHVAVVREILSRTGLARSDGAGRFVADPGPPSR